MCYKKCARERSVEPLTIYFFQSDELRPAKETTKTEADPLQLECFNSHAALHTLSSRNKEVQKGVGRIMRSMPTNLGLIDVAFVGWACHAEGHLGRHAIRIPEDANFFQKKKDWSRTDIFKLS
eukprot:s50_g33.t1